MTNDFKSPFAQHVESYIEYRKQCGVKNLGGDISALKKLDCFLSSIESPVSFSRGPCGI
ncbi:hypothetical protein EVA_06590, partial [gut metagenome]